MTQDDVRDHNCYSPSDKKHKARQATIKAMSF